MTDPWAGFRHVAAIRQLGDGATARCTTPFKFGLELGPTIINLLTPCCETWFADGGEGKPLTCSNCKAPQAIPSSIETDAVGWSELLTWFPEVLARQLDPLTTLVVAQELEDELTRVREHLRLY